MKKTLVLLPFAAFLLMGCSNQGGSSVAPTSAPTTPPAPTSVPTPTSAPTTTVPVPTGDIVLDFTSSEWKDQKITPYVSDNTTLMTFSYGGYTYNDKGSYANSYQETYWLMMKNKWTDGQVEEGEEFAFIGNADAYGKTIDKVSVEVSKQTGGVDFYVDFGTSAFETSPTSGTKYTATASTAATFEATNTGSGQYFAISATKAVGQYRKNGGISKITISFK